MADVLRDALEQALMICEDAASKGCECDGFYRCNGCEVWIAERAEDAAEVLRAALAAVPSSPAREEWAPGRWRGKTFMPVGLPFADEEAARAEHARLEDVALDWALGAPRPYSLARRTVGPWVDVPAEASSATLTRDAAIRRWGEDPQQWPAWTCPRCMQLHSGWSLDCGRCGDGRPADYPFGMPAEGGESNG
jgi:hypothetical protein